MAGPLNLDNYKIEADESTDELIITHIPTGKTTKLSEDTFESLSTEESVIREYVRLEQRTSEVADQEISGGENALYAKDNGKVYTKTDSSLEREVGASSFKTVATGTHTAPTGYSYATDLAGGINRYMDCHIRLSEQDSGNTSGNRIFGHSSEGFSMDEIYSVVYWKDQDNYWGIGFDNNLGAEVTVDYKLIELV